MLKIPHILKNIEVINPQTFHVRPSHRTLYSSQKLIQNSSKFLLAAAMRCIWGERKSQLSTNAGKSCRTFSLFPNSSLVFGIVYKLRFRVN